jgi:hypothetical protein
MRGGKKKGAFGPKVEGEVARSFFFLFVLSFVYEINLKFKPDLDTKYYL